MITVVQMLTADEGFRSVAYKDSKGNTTVGIGFNMDDSNAKSAWLQADIPESFNSIKNSTANLSVASINRMFNICVNSCKTDLASIFPNVSSYPDYVQLALVNLMFNMGKRVFLEFNTFIKLIKEQDYDGASNDLATTKWATELTGRAKRVTALLKGDDSGYSTYSTSSSSTSI
jgi:GH24 family phage-related lysozyme (muramidase)